MLTLKGKTIYLRALEPNDLEFVYAVENDERIWNVSNSSVLSDLSCSVNMW